MPGGGRGRARDRLPAHRHRARLRQRARGRARARRRRGRRARSSSSPRRSAREEYAPDDLRRAAEDSLRNLQVDCLDLLLLHWPNPDFPLEETLGALVGLRDDGLIRHLGVSNFPAGLLRAGARARAGVRRPGRVPPVPGPGRARRARRARRTSWSPPTPRSPAAGSREDPTLREIGEAHGKTAGQVALRWLLDKPQVCAIPKASSHERRVENFEVFDFELERRRARAGSRRCPRTSARSTRASGRTGTPERR